MIPALYIAIPPPSKTWHEGTCKRKEELTDFQIPQLEFRFHALHWPALLFAAGLEPPRRVLTHAHWTMNKSKMSKSKGNVADPIMAMKTYGVDAVRWYLMRTGGSLADDSGGLL